MPTYKFDHWQINGETFTDNPLSIMVDRDLTVTAVYTTVTPPPSACFIATAAYGTPLAPQLNVFRRFRDYCLPAKLTQVYYKISPPFADYIRKHLKVRHAVRLLLDKVMILIKIVS